MLYTSGKRGNVEGPVVRFRVIWGPRSIDLEPGELRFGREDDCAFCSEDPLVSRHHARFIVGNDSVFLEDLGSRNGVFVNGQKLAAKAALKGGDRIRIGGQELVVVAQGGVADDTHGPPTMRFEGLGILGELIEKALAIGHVDEAERLLENPFAQAMQEVTAGRELLPAYVTELTRVTLRVVSVSRNARWMGDMARLYEQLGRPWPADVIDLFYEVARASADVKAAPIEVFVAKLKKVNLGPADRFLAGRVEGLLKQIRAS